VRHTFDDLVFDTDTRQLTVAAREVRLSPKAFDLLALLIERRPRVVSKAEIHERLWPEVHVSESSLPSLVSEIRAAIRDGERATRLLHTVPKHGYAFRPGADTPTGVAWLLGALSEIALRPGENVLGRDEGAGVIVLNSSTVSRRHARIVIGDDSATVADLGSKNGTYVNDRRVSAAVRVADGDQVRIGSLLFTFRTWRPSTTTQTATTGGAGGSGA
jgi:hypothetical protein